MLNVRLSKISEQKLDKISRLTKRPKSFFVKEELDNYLEDLEDAYIALDRISDPNRALLTTKEVLDELRLNPNFG